MAKASSETSRYIAEYNIWMHHLLDGEGTAIFREAATAVSLEPARRNKADYSDATNGLAKQRMIQQVMSAS